MFVLFPAEEIQEFITDSQLSQHSLPTMRQLSLGTIHNKHQHAHEITQLLRLLLGQRTAGRVVEFLIVVTESLEFQILKHLR